MKTTTTRAVILGHRQFGENDKVIHLYSQDLGKIETIAKGSKKIASKFTGHLETLNLVEAALYFGPRNIILTEIVSEKNFIGSSENLDTMLNAIQIANTIKNLVPENQIIDNLLPLTIDTIKHLQLENKAEMINLAFTIKLLKMLGYTPDFKSIESKMAEKYLKFLHFVGTQGYSEICRIRLENNEKHELKKILNRILEYHHLKVLI